MAGYQGRKRRVRFTYQYAGMDDNGHLEWNVIDNMHPPKVLGCFPTETEAILFCRKKNLRDKGKDEDGN